MSPRSTHECDVLVIGASLEGCIAAIKSAQKGKKVLLIENNGSLGQAATNGLYIYLPDREHISDEARSYMNYITLNAGNKENKGKRLYHDQQLKVVLKRLLDEAGVQVLTHMFLVGGTAEQCKINTYRICGKTGYIDVYASTVIDATDKMEAAASLGLRTEAKSKEVKASIKFNQVPTNAIRQFASNVVDEGNGYLIGEANCHLNKNNKGISYSAEHIEFYHDTEFKELIFTGITAEVENVNAFTLSQAQAGLRIFAYDLRNELRNKVEGFEKINIIQVSPRVDCYGIRKVTENPYKNLILMNNDVESYNNIDALERGLVVAKDI